MADDEKPLSFRLRVQLDEMRIERDELQRVFDLRWEADMRAIKVWQAETKRELTWPDRADMVVWLLKKLDESEKKAKEFSDALTHIEHSSRDGIRVVAQALMAARGEVLP